MSQGKVHKKQANGRKSIRKSIAKIRNMGEIEAVCEITTRRTNTISVISSDDDDSEEEIKHKQPALKTYAKKAQPKQITCTNELNDKCSSCDVQKLLLNQIIKTQLEMKAQLQNITRMIKQSIVKSENTSLLESLEFKMLESLPEVTQFNEDLTDEITFAQMVESLHIYGGRDIKTAIKTMLSKMISHETAIKTNWIGVNNKFKFSQMTNIVKLILVSARRNTYTKDTTQDDVEREIKAWLRNASDREFSRQKRANSKIDI